MAEKVSNSNFTQEDISSGQDVDVSKQNVETIEGRRTNDLQPKKEDLADIEPGQEGKREETETFKEKSKMQEKKDGGGSCCGG